MTVTHNELIGRAIHWLCKSRRCLIVVTRAALKATELPDAIGWMGDGRSYLLECKTSRDDFFRDQLKPHRRFPELGVGNERWYLTPPGLVRPQEVPDHWGLLECEPKRLRTRKPAPWQNHDQKNVMEELRLAIAHAKRLAAGDVVDPAELERLHSNFLARIAEDGGEWPEYTGAGR